MAINELKQVYCSFLQALCIYPGVNLKIRDRSCLTLKNQPFSFGFSVDNKLLYKGMNASNPSFFLSQNKRGP